MRFALLTKNDKVKVQLNPDEFKKELKKYLKKNKGNVDKAIEEIKKDLFNQMLHT